MCYPGMWTSFVKIYTQDPGIVTRKHGVISQVVGSISQECELHLLQEAVKLSPIDINKKLYAFIDSAVTVGTAYILAQRKDEKDESKGYNICGQHYL